MVRVLLAPTDSDAEVAGSTIGTRLARVQMALDRFIGELPPALRFDTASFQAYAAVGQGGAFALLHVSRTVDGASAGAVMKEKGKLTNRCGSMRTFQLFKEVDESAEVCSSVRRWDGITCAIEDLGVQRCYERHHREQGEKHCARGAI